MSGKREKTLRQAHGIRVQAKREERAFAREIARAAQRAAVNREAAIVERSISSRRLMAFALLALIAAFGLGMLSAAVHG